VLHVDGGPLGWCRKYTMQMLRDAVTAEKAEVGFDSLFPEPLLVYSPRRYSLELLEDFCPHSFCARLPW